MKYRSAIVAAAAAVLLPAVALATDAATDKKDQAKPVAAPEAKAKQTDAKSADTKAKCTYVTGSRIKHDPPVDCDSGVLGLRTYSAEEIQQTGQIDLNEALRWLDPRFQ